MECASGKMKVGTHKWVSAFFVAAEAKVGRMMLCSRLFCFLGLFYNWEAPYCLFSAENES